MSQQLPAKFGLPLTSRQIEKNIHLADKAADLAPYAIMCNNAYARDIPIPLPEGWTENENLRRPRVEPSKKSGRMVGLALAVFEKRENHKLVEVVVAFRGTDGLSDWIQNLIPFFRNQVEPARQAFEKILLEYAGQPVKVTDTGHSLGGGLAFHMSFAYPHIDAIAFNASPVTKAGQEVDMSNKRTSVWESGEALQAVRNTVNWSRQRWRGVERIEFRFLHGFTIKQHLMEDFALNLTKLGATRSSTLRALTDSWRI